MAMTNAERQAQYKQRLRDRAAKGVTSEMVIKAAKLNFEAWVKEYGAFEREPPSWEKFLAEARKCGKASFWQQHIPAERDDDYSEFGEDAPMMRAVARVAASVLRPPDGD